MLGVERGQPPESGDSARDVGVQPARLVRAFKRHYHMSLGKYTWQARLEWAAERLRGSSESIAAISLRAGFADQSHLTRALTEARGLSPARYRAQCRAPTSLSSE